MVDGKYTRVSRVENFFSMLLTRYEVSNNIFVGSDLPPTISKEWDDMALIDTSSLGDYDAFTYGSVNVYLYARPTGTTLRKNVKVLDAMEEALDRAVSECADAHYTLRVNWRDHDYDSSRGFHYNIVNVEVKIR